MGGIILISKPTYFILFPSCYHFSLMALPKAFLANIVFSNVSSVGTILVLHR